MGSLRISHHVMTCHRFAVSTSAWKKKGKKERKMSFESEHSDKRNTELEIHAIIQKLAPYFGTREYESTVFTSHASYVLQLLNYSCR